jgi:hypothetical protein
MKKTSILGLAFLLFASQAAFAQQPAPKGADAKAITPAGWTSANPGISKSACPPGHYVVGIEAKGSPGSTKYCIGCVQAVRVLCQTLQ